MIAGFLVLFMLYYCAIYQICLIPSFQCLLYFDFIIADARLNGPGAILCNSPNHRVNDAAEKCPGQLSDKLMEVYGENTSSHGLLLAVKLVVILIQTFVLKVGLEELSGK